MAEQLVTSRHGVAVRWSIVSQLFYRAQIFHYVQTLLFALPETAIELLGRHVETSSLLLHGGAFQFPSQAGLRPLERHFFDHHSPQQVILRLQRTECSLTAVEAAVSQSRLQLRGLRMRPARGAS